MLNWWFNPTLYKDRFPSTAKVIDNTRYKSLQFQITEDNVVHGFGGYFEAFLYKDITLSIKPETHSQGMFSWFPILFPLRVSSDAIRQVYVLAWYEANQV